MDNWISKVKRELKEYKDMAYNVYTMLQEYYTYEEIRWMPLRNVKDLVKEFKPRFEEIQRRRKDEELKRQLKADKEAKERKRNEARAGKQRRRG